MKNHIILLLYINLHYYPRGVRLHLKNQTTSSRNHLKNTFWKDSSSNHLTHFGNNSLPSYIGKIEEKKTHYNTTIILHETELQLLFSRRVQTCPDLSRHVQTCPDLTTKNFISETLLVMVFNLVIEPFTTFFVSFTVSNVSQQVCIQENMCIN